MGMLLRCFGPCETEMDGMFIICLIRCVLTTLTRLGFLVDLRRLVGVWVPVISILLDQRSILVLQDPEMKPFGAAWPELSMMMS